MSIDAASSRLKPRNNIDAFDFSVCIEKMKNEHNNEDLTHNQYSKQIFGCSIIFVSIFVGFVIIKHYATVETLEARLGLLLFGRDC